MVGYAAGSAGAIQPGEDQQIIAYLSAAQTPDAVTRRKTQAALASAAGGGSDTQKVSAAPDQIAARHRYDAKTIGFISLVGVAVLILIARWPATVPIATRNRINSKTRA
jgi:hypothetical protein